MVTDHIYLVPLSMFVLLPATICITYVTAVLLGHVEPDFPYISDTGTKVPESCIFGQLLDIGVILLAICFYVRYKQIHTYCQHHQLGDKIPRLNLGALILGWIMTVGVSVVANFQETNALVIHLIGALLIFGAGTLYVWINALLSYLVYPIINTRTMAHFRLGIAIFITAAFFATSVVGPLAVDQFHGSDRTKWRPEDGGFQLHVLSTAAEWTWAMTFDVFILTFVREFQRITVASPQVYLHIEELRAPVPVEETPREGDECNPQSSDVPPFREFLA